jgi:chromosome segregation ATPase
VPLFGRRRAGAGSLDSEYERIHAIRTSAEQELGRLRRELTERVAAVESRERELADAVARVRREASASDDRLADDTTSRAEVVLAARAQELTRREEEVAARERALVERENEATRQAQGPASTPEERLAEIEKRLAALQEAEKAFVRTRAELAARSDQLDRRAALLEEQARAGTPAPGLSSAELAEIDERLGRLERETREASLERGFGQGLRALETKGTRRQGT